MENYIFNCYLNWLKKKKKEEGNIFKRISKLTLFANILIALLVVVLVSVIVVFILAYLSVINVNWVLLPLIVEGIVGVITYIYTSHYEIDHSYDNLTEYKLYCKNLYDELCTHSISNRSFLSEIIKRIDTRVENVSVNYG